LGVVQGCPASRAACCWRSTDRPEPRLVYFIYSLLMGLAALLLVPYWLVQGLRHGKYISNLCERLGVAFPALDKLPAPSTGAIWIHSVGVGEGLSRINLAPGLKEGFPQPASIFSTTPHNRQ